MKRFSAAVSAALLVLAGAIAFSMFSPRASQGKDADGASPVVGLQLWSLRAELGKDVPGSLKLAHEMGIREVEAAGLFGQSAEQFRQSLDDAGLTCTSAHIQYADLQHEFDKAVSQAKALGAKYVICPWIPHKTGFSLDEARVAVGNFNKWGKALQEQGLTFGYHPHGYEFAPTDKGTAFDVLIKETDPKLVVFEMDVFWAYHAGQDPVKLMEQHPDRFQMLHLKDMKKGTQKGLYTGQAPKDSSVAVGTGEIKYAEVLAEAKKIGIKHYYIEDEAPDAAKQIPETLVYLKSQGMTSDLGN